MLEVDQYKHIFFETSTIICDGYYGRFIGKDKKLLQNNITLWTEKKYIEQSKIALANINETNKC